MNEPSYRAYNAMLIFLDRYWRRGGGSSSEIAILLGSLQPGPDGYPVDIALWEDWNKAYEAAEAVSGSP